MWGSPEGTQYGAFLRRYFGITDPAGIQIIPELLPVVAVEADRPEYGYLLGTRLWTVSPSTPGVAAEFSQVGVRNPSGSGLLSVVQDVSFFDEGALVTRVFEIRTAVQTVVDASAAAANRDMRWVGTGDPATTRVMTQGITNSAAVPLGNIVGRFRVLSGDTQTVKLGIVLAPGFDLFVGADTVNVGSVATFRGYERRLRDGEA